MSKRSIEETNIESLNSEFEYDDSENQLRKKIKLENQKILGKIKEINEDIDISEHKVHKFLLIFHTLVGTINSQEGRKETNRFVTDTILQIVNIIAGFLKNNIDRLNVPVVLKSASKKLKSLFISQTKTQRRGKQASQNQKMARTQVRLRRSVRPVGMGQKNNDQVRGGLGEKQQLRFVNIV